MAESSTEVLGRKTYALMEYWETDQGGFTPAELESARRWRALDRVPPSAMAARPWTRRGHSTRTWS